MAMPAGYKPSPLGYGSPRSSPFRRAESPSDSPSAPGSRQITPTPSPTKHNTSSLFTPSRFASSSQLPSSQSLTPTKKSSESNRTMHIFPSPSSPTSELRTASTSSLPQPHTQRSPRDLLSSASLYTSTTTTTTATSHPTFGQGSALSQLQPAQVHVLRDGFQVLDRDSDGVVNREDVVDMLTQLGLPATPSDVSQFFPPGGAQTQTLASFLNAMAGPLAALSPATELLSAFSAFDDDDSGQVDLAELRDALLRTAPEPGERAPTSAEVDKVIAGFSGRRAFGSGGGGLGGGVASRKRGEVFRYQEFVQSILGGQAGAPEHHGVAGTGAGGGK